MIIGILVVVFLASCIYVLFFRRDPAIEHYKRELEKAKEFNRQLDADSINERNRMAVARKAFETGKPVVGDVDEEGNLKIRVIE
jgi:hypothetical protein